MKQSMWRDDFPTSTNPLAFFLYVSKPHVVAAALAVTAVTVAGIASSVVPYVFKLIVDSVTHLDAPGGYQALVWACTAYIVISALKELIWRASGYAGAHWATGVRATARQTLSAYLTLHSRDYFSNRFAGSLANKISHASSGVRDMVESMLWQFLSLTVNVVVSIGIAVYVNWVVGLVFITWVAVVLPLNIYLARKRVPLTIATQAAETELTGMTVDLLANVSAMQEHTSRPFELERLKTMIERRRLTGLRNWHFGEDTLTLNGFIQALFAAGMVFAAVYYAGVGTLSSGDIILIVTIIYRIEDQFLFLGSHINTFSERWGEIQESLEEILLAHEITDTPRAVSLKVSKGTLTFDAVRFAYHATDVRVLDDFSLTVPSHMKVGLVGKSGAGKSTLVKLLLRHYELSRGVIAIDGQDIAQVTLDSLRAAVAVVPQEAVLFHRTLRENISYGRPGATDAEVAEAARLAHAHEFITRLPKGYETLVGERGVKLSGGERQRIAIARAILKNAPILVLDEATASLDSESEALIQKALHTLMEGKTVIAIAHRLSTLREMDRIIVLSGGEIAEDGTHEQLLTRGGIYAGLWSHQAGGFLADEFPAVESETVYG